MAFFILIMIGILVLLFLGRRAPSAGKKGGLKYFYKAGYQINYFIEICREKKWYQSLFGKITDRSSIKKKIKMLYPMDWNKEQEAFYYSEKIAIVLLILFVGSGFGIGITLAMDGQDIFQNDRLKRADYGEKSQNVTLTAEIEEQPVEVDIEVTERKYNQKEALRLLKKAAEELETLILGENTSADEVRTDLNFVHSLENGLITVEYELDHYQYVDTEGKLTKNIPKDGGVVLVTARLCYGEWDYQSVFAVHVLPEILSKEEKIRSDLREEIERENEKSRYEQWQSLPQKLYEKKIIWKKSKDFSGWIFFGLCMGSSVLIYFGKDVDLKKEIEKRNQQMLRDYPEIVNKLTLYLQAGMTVYGAWGKMVQDYEKRKEKDSGLKRYVYEEMLYTYREVQDGVPEMDAYLRFGKRCKLQRYMKFSALLVQNLRKGASGLLSLLEYEAQEAYEERKNIAKRAGEEAGTKLLFPMFLMLAIVMIIMIVPAFLSFRLGG